MGMGPLNLSDADTSGFDPVPSGQYKVEVFEASRTKITKDDGKLPQDTPGIKIQFKILGDNAGDEGEEYEFYNRRAFNNYWLPGADYSDVQAGRRMRGMFVNLLKALGYEEEEVMSGEFDLDVDDLNGRECIATLGIQPEKGGYPAQNKVNGVKSLEEAAATSSGLL